MAASGKAGFASVLSTFQPNNRKGNPMKRSTVVAFAGLAAAVLALPAAAQTYIGFNAGQSDYKFSNCGNPCDSKGKALKFFGGMQLHPNVAVEVGYTDLGKTTFGTANRKANAWEVSGVGSWGIPIGQATGMRLAVLGRLGIYTGDLKATVPSTGGETKHGTTSLTFGFGAQADLSRALGVRAEWQRFSKMGGGGFGEKGDIDALSVGVLWRFN